MTTPSLLPMPIAQDQAMGLLTRALEQQRIANAYLLHGGSGKSRAAYWFAQQLLTTDLSSPATLSHPDLIHLEPTTLENKQLYTRAQAQAAKLEWKAPQIRIQQVRQIIELLALPPLLAKRRVIIIEDAELLSKEAANALLKSIEEANSTHSVFILLSDTQSDILPTIRSRCQIVTFRQLPDSELLAVLQQVCPDAPPGLAAIANGSVGNAIAAFQSIQKIPVEQRELLAKPFQSAAQAFKTAQVVQTLEREVQIWLLVYIQQSLWRQFHDSNQLEAFERAIAQFNAHCQARLVWEVLLLAVQNTPWNIEFPDIPYQKSAPVAPPESEAKPKKGTSSQRKKAEPAGTGQPTAKPAANQPAVKSTPPLHMQRKLFDL